VMGVRKGLVRANGQGIFTHSGFYQHDFYLLWRFDFGVQ
jgi:hypothetical protein